jgi:hypothetical protein
VRVPAPFAKFDWCLQSASSRAINQTVATLTSRCCLRFCIIRNCSSHLCIYTKNVTTAIARNCGVSPVRSVDEGTFVVVAAAGDDVEAVVVVVVAVVSVEVPVDIGSTVYVAPPPRALVVCCKVTAISESPGIIDSVNSSAVATTHRFILMLRRLSSGERLLCTCRPLCAFENYHQTCLQHSIISQKAEKFLA